jgi:hypothetical protein
MSASEDRDVDASPEPGQIERQIEQSRHHLTETLTALEHKLSARQLTNDMIEAVRDTVLGSGDGQQTMLDLIRRNPLPATLIGIGVGWMVFGSSVPRSERRPPPANAGMDPMPANAGAQPMASGPESALHIGGAAHAHGAGRRAHGRIGRLQDRAGAMMQDNPLAVGAVGAVIGALIGAILPMSRREQDWLADTQADLVDQARDLGRDALARAGDVARHAGRAAVEVVEQELGVTKPRPPGNGRTDGSIH